MVGFAVLTPTCPTDMLAPRSFAPRVAKPKSDPRYTAVTDQVKAAAHKLKQHPPAATKARQASKSARPPANERMAGAKAKVVDAVKEAPAPKPQPTSFKALLRAEIDKAMPKTLGDTEKFMEGGAQSQMKGAAGAGVEQQKDAAAGPADKAVKKAPDAGAILEQPATALPAEPQPAAPSIPGDKAMPAPATPPEVSLQETKRDTDQALQDEKVKPESLHKANDPRFTAVADAKAQVAMQADRAPAQFRAKEGAVLAGARAQAAGTARTGALLMANRKGAGNAQVLGRQQQQAAKEEAERAKVATTVEGIYSRTKARVEARLGRGVGAVRPGRGRRHRADEGVRRRPALRLQAAPLPQHSAGGPGALAEGCGPGPARRGWRVLHAGPRGLHAQQQGRLRGNGGVHPRRGRHRSLEGDDGGDFGGVLFGRDGHESLHGPEYGGARQMDHGPRR